MKIILLSGGSGKRLWPLSNDNRSKQFLKVLKNPNMVLESMVQRVWRQLETLGLEKDTLIATGKSQVDLLKSQIGNDLNLIIEPERKDTFPAIALAASYLYTSQEVSGDEVVVVLPVDPYVDISYFKRLLDIENALLSSDAELALMGVSPTFPSSKYGYIIPEFIENGIVKVSHFKEKPSVNVASSLIKEGALWNCGVLAFQLKSILNIMHDREIPLRYEDLLKQYGNLPKISIDYEVIEKSNKIIAIPYDGEWKDLGTWNTLTEEIDTNIIGKAKLCEESKDTHIVNELDIPIIGLGVSNLIIAASPDGILVSEKESSPKIKELVSDYNQIPMYEERYWGWYKILDFTKYPDKREVLTKRIGISAGKSLSYQYHEYRNEIWTIVNGEGTVVINDATYNVKTGDVIEIPSGTKHAIKAKTALEIIEVQNGTSLHEEDVKRIELEWTDIKNFSYVD